MDNAHKTRAQLLHELNELQQRLAAVEAVAAVHREHEALVNSIEGIVWEFDLSY